MTLVTSRRVQVAPWVELDVHMAGAPGDPVVVLLHGFPESAHSWRHQMAPLAASGFHVIAPDQRGYAGSSAPPNVRDYGADLLTADICALLDDVGADRAVIVGHDWGALVAWHLAMLHPDRCAAVLAASVPFNTWPAPPIDVFRSIHGDRFFYILYFQEPGVAEAELDAAPARFLKAIYWVASGDVDDGSLTSSLPGEGTTLIEAFEHQLGGQPGERPAWLSEHDFDVFVGQFERSGFFGPVSWYRNFDTNYELTKHIPPSALVMPTAFVAGAVDPVIAGRNLVVNQDASLPNHLGSHLIDGAGHWVQQEAPEAFNEWLIATLARV